MEYVEGLTLKEVIDFQCSKKFETQQICGFITQIVIALDYLHNEGVAHRDLKAENVKITTNGWLKLLDFGQAKDGLNSVMSYKTGKLGTIPYNAPEQYDL